MSESGGLPQPALDWSTYSRIMGSRTWNHIVRAFCDIRAYDGGLEWAFKMLTATERFRCRMHRKQYDRCRMSLFLFVLTMLDRGDRWAEYLEVWDSLRQHTPIPVTYSMDVLNTHGPRIQPYILWTTPDSLAVHFLYILSHRRDLIERKLARVKAGVPRSGDRHASQTDLSWSAIHDRLASIRAQI